MTHPNHRAMRGIVLVASDYSVTASYSASCNHFQNKHPQSMGMPVEKLRSEVFDFGRLGFGMWHNLCLSFLYHLGIFGMWLQIYCGPSANMDLISISSKRHLKQSQRQRKDLANLLLTPTCTAAHYFTDLIIIFCICILIWSIVTCQSCFKC